MTTAIVSGREGTGKTTQVEGIAKEFQPVAWAVLELKDKAKIDKLRSDTFSVDTLYATYPREHERAKQVDPVGTLKNILVWNAAILRGKELPKTIVIDGISDLRDYAIRAWLVMHNKETGECLTSIKYKDWGAWGEVNSTVREILEPLINLALEADINLLMTAQMKDEYVDGEKMGYIPDLKEWMSYPVQCLFTLYKEEKSDVYSLSCEKEPENASWQVDDLEKGRGLLKALLSHDLLNTDNEMKKKLTAERKEFIVRYTLEGIRQRAIIEGVDVETVKAQVLEFTENAAKDLEVLE